MTQANLPSSFLYCGTFRSYIGVKYELIAGSEDLQGVYQPIIQKRIIQIHELPTKIDRNIYKEADREI